METDDPRGYPQRTRADKKPYLWKRSLIRVFLVLGQRRRRRTSVRAARVGVSCFVGLKGLAQAKIIKKTVILFWLINRTI